MSKDNELPEVKVPSEQDLVDSRMNALNPRQQRFIHLYLSGQHNLKDIAELLNMSVSGIRLWLRNPEIKSLIDEIQGEEDEIVRQGLKAIRLSALYKMQRLLDSPMDAIAYQAARDVLDRTGHKAPTKQETKIDVTYTFEEQMKDAIKTLKQPEEFIDVNDYEVIK